MPDEWRARFFGGDPRVYWSPREVDAERREVEERMKELDDLARLEREMVAEAGRLRVAAEALTWDTMTENELAYAATLAARQLEEDR